MKSSGSTAIGFLSAVVAALLCAASEAGHSSYCQIWQADIRKSDLGARTSRNYKGLWISEKCEIQPGPLFTVRRYHFLRSGHFSLIRYYYRDPWCTRPSHSVSATGAFDNAAASPAASWVVPGALEPDYALRKVVVVPFDVAAASQIGEKVNASCPGKVRNKWRPFKRYKVLSYEARNARKAKYRSGSDTKKYSDCTGALNLHFNELQLIRLEHRSPIHLGSHHRLFSETVRRYQSYLFLGADGFPTGSRPTYYQVPLIPSQTEHCPICHVLSKATSTTPPVLPAPFNTPSPAPLRGRWISLRCEVRPFGLFLRRTLTFRAPTWSARHAYFKDPSCREPMFTLTATGRFHQGPTSAVIPDALEYDFAVLDTQIAAEDRQFAAGMACGGGGAPVGKTVNLTVFGGCPELGITVPAVEPDLVRMETEGPEMTRVVYLGQSTEDGTRPVSFQPPLVQCSADGEEQEQDLFESYNELRPLPLTSSAVAAVGKWFCLMTSLVLLS